MKRLAVLHAAAEITDDRAQLVLAHAAVARGRIFGVGEQ